MTTIEGITIDPSPLSQLLTVYVDPAGLLASITFTASRCVLVRVALGEKLDSEVLVSNDPPTSLEHGHTVLPPDRKMVQVREGAITIGFLNDKDQPERTSDITIEGCEVLRASWGQYV